MAIDTTKALEMVKYRLNRLQSDTTLDGYLLARIGAAISELAGNGITLTDSPDDMMLLVDMTVWEYQSRDSGAGMPDWLRLRRRERWLRENRENGEAAT